MAAAVLPGLLAYQANSFMLRELGAGKTGLVLYLGPVSAALVHDGAVKVGLSLCHVRTCR